MASGPPEELRRNTDQQVLRLLYDGPRSRADLAAAGGFSKPTASESVRRLTERGLVMDTGEQRRGIGRAASLVAIRDDAGVTLAVLIEPSGVRVRAHRVTGEVVAECVIPLPQVHGSRAVAAALRKATRTVSDRLEVPIRCAAVSAADPVRRSDGRLVELPDSPFLVGSLDPRRIIAPFVVAEVIVDNDVNWAAFAESSARLGHPDFCYLHLGTGLGAAVVSDGVVRRGRGGLVGEIAHVVVEGPDGHAVPLTEVFANLGLRQANSAAVDVARVQQALADRAVAPLIGRALVGVVGACVAMADPEFIVLAGPWGAAARAPLERALRGYQRPVQLVAPLVDEPSAAGVRAGAVEALRASLARAAYDEA